MKYQEFKTRCGSVTFHGARYNIAKYWGALCDDDIVW